MLRNLVSNAVKYTRAGSVQLRASSQQAFVRIEVCDTGIGIPADQLDHIYEEFFQVGGSPNTVRDGYGLGLSIVQRIVRLLDLRLEVTSEIGKGSTFALTVPASHVSLLREAAHSAEPRTAGMSAHRPHVLLVEDDQAVRCATTMLLKVAGYRVIEAACLSQATAQAREHQNLDLLITDYHLGSTETGMDVIRAVRAEVGPDLKALLVTGDTSSAVKDLEHDANTRIASKPINADEFLRLLELLQSCAQTQRVTRPLVSSAPDIRGSRVLMPSTDPHFA